uniref:Uncharacterized protein n=1 Tax=viral metagenome TaxID=1070528 RepID=A0A6M3LAG6_9ZZZZ
MDCPACNGKVADFKVGSFITLDQLGVCKSCGGVHLAEKRTILAKKWCSCPQTSIDKLTEKQIKLRNSQEIYFFTDSGEHGWMHTLCGQITQTG